MTNFKMLKYFTIFMILLGSIQFAGAADTTFTPSISLRGQYDDNVSFERGGEKNEDFLYIIKPEFTYDYATEINNLTAKADVSYQSYIEKNDYNSLDSTVNLVGESNLTELLTLFADLKYVNDNTLESELLQTGQVGREREDRQRYDLTGGLFFNVTELIRVGGDYQYRKTEYDLESTENSNRVASEDYSDDTVSFIYNQRLKNELDSVTFRTSYAYREVRTHETNTYRVILGWIREFSETFSVAASLGGRFTEQYQYQAADDSSTQDSERVKNDTTGLLADVTFFKETYSYRTEFNYRRDQVYIANGGAREVDQFTVKLRRNLTERLRLRLVGSLYLTRDVDEQVNEDSQFYEIHPSIIYNLTEYHLLSFHYSYQYEYDNARSSGEEDADRNRAWVNVQFNFPRKL